MVKYSKFFQPLIAALMFCKGGWSFILALLFTTSEQSQRIKNRIFHGVHQFSPEGWKMKSKRFSLVLFCIAFMLFLFVGWGTDALAASDDIAEKAKKYVKTGTCGDYVDFEGMSLDLEIKSYNYGLGPVSLMPPKASYHRDKRFKYIKKWFVRHISFSPDGSHLLVNMCHYNRREYCRIARYYLDSNQWQSLPYGPNNTYIDPEYSPDGKTIVFAQCNCRTFCCDSGMSLFLMDADGRDLRPIGSGGTREGPTFSRDGSKLIFWQCGGFFDDKIIKERVRAYNLWELELNTGKETRLLQLGATDFRDSPRYLPDGKRFIFAGANFIGIGPGEEFCKTYKTLYGQSRMFLTGPEESTPLKPIWAENESLFVNDISKDGKWLLYSGRGGLYMANLSMLNLKDSRLVWRCEGRNDLLVPNCIGGASFSPKGDLIAFIFEKGTQLNLIKWDGSEWVEINSSSYVRELWKDQ